ncbi:MAG: T9SS type A sorting domain-containing protein [Salinivirgaceae bacterium]|nr:T9SS type A sorting domain-containing protein [Salinivirgaceae bacterium]
MSNGSIYEDIWWCDETQNQAFSVTASSTISSPCESNFNASVTATVTNGSGDYNYNWSATNGNSFYGGWGTKTVNIIYVSENGAPKCYSDVTKSKTVTCEVSDNVWKIYGGSQKSTVSGSTTLKAIRFTPNTFYGEKCFFNRNNGWYGSYAHGSATIASVTGSGYGTRTFTWYQSSSPDGSYSAISNSNVESLTINEPANTTFYRQYTNSSSCSSETYHAGYTTTADGTKNYFTCIIPIDNVSAKIGSSTSVEIGYGGSTTLSCTSTGGRVDKTYTWYKSSSVNGSYEYVATGANYTPTGLTSTTYYKCKVTDADHSNSAYSSYISDVWSNVVTVGVRYVLMVTSFTSGPIETSSGANVTLSASAYGGNNFYSFQWKESSDNITWTDPSSPSSYYNTGAGTNSIIVSRSGVTRYYKVIVTSDGQTKERGPVKVKWRAPLSITAISRSASEARSGASVTLSVTASGGTENNYSYQWKESLDNSNWTNISTSSSCSVIGSGQTKYYKVVVTNDGQTKEASTSVTWRSALAITAISRSASETSSGSSVTLSITASGGTGSYSYQWKESTDNSNWTNISQNSSCSVSGSGQTKYYKVVVTNDGQTKEASTSVIWRSPLAAGTISGGGAYHYGANVTLTANPTGGLEDNSYNYQWQSTTSSIWSDIAGANSKQYSAKGYNQTISYRVRVSNDGQTQTSDPVDVTWRPELVAGNITGGNVTTYSNNSITLTAHPSGGTENNYSYQWKQSTDDINWSVIAGQTSQTCTVTGSEQTMHFKVVVTNDNQTKESQSVYITWGSALTAGNITSNPEDNSTYSGGSITLTAHPKVGDQQNVNYEYQWQAEENSTWNDIPNANSQSYTESNTNESGSKLYKYYRIKVTAENQTAYSARYEVSWRPALVAGTITGGGGYSYGASATLQAHPSGGLGGNNYSYQWQVSDDNLSWSDIAGADNKEYSVTGKNQTKFFRVKVSGDSQNKTAESVQVIWRPELAVGSVSGGGVTTYSGGNITLSTTPSGGNGAYSYKWQESTDNTNWNDIPGSDHNPFAVSSSNPESTNLIKYYRAVVTGDNQTKETQSVTVTYRPALTAGAITGGNITTFCGNSITIEAHPSGGFGENYSYQWQEENNSSWNDLQNETSERLMVSTLNMGSATMSRKFRVKVFGDSQDAYSDYVTISWRPILTVSTPSITEGSTPTYSGASVTLKADASGGNDEFNYQWQVSEDNAVWTDIQGAIYSSLIETGNNETDAIITMYYRVAVSGDSQSGISGVTEITRRPSLKVGNILGNNIVYGGDAVNLSVVATGGDESYNYQWYRKSTESDWAAVGTNSSSFSDSFENNTNVAISYLYKVVVSGDSQEKTTEILPCSWVAPMKIDTLLYAQDKLSYGTNTPITVRIINGSGFYDYQWQTLLDGVWQDIPNTDKPTYIVENITEAKEYRCVVSDSLYPTKTITTDAAQLDVYPDLVPGTTFGTSYTVGNTPITIGGTTPSGGNGEYHYRWEKCSASDNGEFVPIDDTTATINVLPDCNTTYRRYDISGDQEKLAFEIQVNVPLLSGAITVDDLADFYYAGQQLPLLQNETEASGGNVGGSASYQWYWKKGNDTDFTPIEGATSAEFQPTGLKETTSFYRAIVDSNETQNSNVIELKIKMPNIELANQKERYCKGDAVNIVASGVEGGEYKWFDADGNLIASGATLNLNSIDVSSTLKLKTYINSNDLLTEENVELTVVEMSPDFITDQIILDAGGVVHFTNNGSNYTQCEWDFGDGADGSYESNPWHYYNSDGVFDVKLRLSSSEGCVAEITKTGYISVNEATVTNVDESSAGNVSVYPNPASSYLMVETSGEAEVVIINNAGAALFKTNVFATEQIDISAYPEGTYTVIVVESNGNVHYEKIVKY